MCGFLIVVKNPITLNDSKAPHVIVSRIVHSIGLVCGIE